MELNYTTINEAYAITLSVCTEKGDSAYTYLSSIHVYADHNYPPRIEFETSARKFITNFYKLLFSPSAYANGLLCEARVYFKHAPKDYLRINFRIYNDENKNELVIFNKRLGTKADSGKIYDCVQVMIPEKLVIDYNPGDFEKSIDISYVSVEAQDSANDQMPVSAAE
jgi:hypothetical protein